LDLVVAWLLLASGTVMSATAPPILTANGQTDNALLVATLALLSLTASPLIAATGTPKFFLPSAPQILASFSVAPRVPQTTSASGPLLKASASSRLVAPQKLLALVVKQFLLAFGTTSTVASIVLATPSCNNPAA
jgi:hypothetical protein